MLVSTALDPDMIQALEDTDGEHSVQTTLVLSQRKAFSKKMENAYMHVCMIPRIFVICKEKQNAVIWKFHIFIQHFNTYTNISNI